jgi:aromatic-L-amino-acid decarboxylase
MEKSQAMIDRIQRLEKIARQLEPDHLQRHALMDGVTRYADDFLDHIYEIPVYVPTEDEGAGLLDSPISEQGTDIETVLSLIKHNVDRPGLNPASGGHLGYIPGGGIYFSALADYLAAITNRYAGVYFASPGAVKMENMLLEWMASIVGYPKSATGNLTSGGSIANLIGIIAARENHELKARDYARSVIYLTKQLHHTVTRSIRIAGIGECILRFVQMDDHYRMSPEALESSIKKDKSSGLNPWLILASAGTTDVGAVDPLEVIGDIARTHRLWFHVDAAYGAFFALCEEGKKILKGMEKSDSIVMDPHKGLFLPYGSGAVLVKDATALKRAFAWEASYMQDAIAEEDTSSPADLSPELTKHFRALRLWLPLKLVGVAPFRAAVEEKLMLARYFYDEIQKVDGIEVGPYPDLSVVTFRHIPKKGDANAFNERLVKEIQRDGRVFLSSTTLDGKYIIRLAVLAFRTHLETIDLALKILKQKVSLLEEKGRI